MHDGDYWLEVFEPDGVSISWVEPFLTKEAAINVLLHSQLPARVTLDGETIASTGVICIGAGNAAGRDSAVDNASDAEVGPWT